MPTPHSEGFIWRVLERASNLATVISFLSAGIGASIIALVWQHTPPLDGTTDVAAKAAEHSRPTVPPPIPESKNGNGAVSEPQGQPKETNGTAGNSSAPPDLNEGDREQLKMSAKEGWAWFGTFSNGKWKDPLANIAAERPEKLVGRKLTIVRKFNLRENHPTRGEIPDVTAEIKEPSEIYVTKFFLEPGGEQVWVHVEVR